MRVPREKKQDRKRPPTGKAARYWSDRSGERKPLCGVTLAALEARLAAIKPEESPC